MFVNQMYFMNMGWVDQHDWFAGKYSVSIRGKKWYWPIFIRLLDMAIINAWIIHKYVNGTDRKMNLLDFKREICVAYLKGESNRASFGRKKAQGPSKVPRDVIFDQKEHFLEKRDKQQRCQNKPCSGLFVKNVQ